MLDGSSCRASRSTWADAGPMETPWRRSNEIVTAGSCPEWFTVSGPTVVVRVASDASGISVPVLERMYSRLSADRSCWFWGSSSITTQYWVVMELLPQYQQDLSALSLLYIRSNTGTLIPLASLATLTTTVGPLTVNHSGQLPAVTISFDLRQGVSIGPASAQ